jgi:antitoxin component of RelBE/YafQ-DinJ toxin-antitoxin module
MSTTVLLDTQDLAQPKASHRRNKSVRLTMTESEWRQAHQVADTLGLSLNETIRRLLAQAADQLGV